MTIPQIKQAIKESEYFQSYPSFKQNITLQKKNLEHLHDLYGQASRLGLDYLKQNQNITVSDFNLIKSIYETAKLQGSR